MITKNNLINGSVCGLICVVFMWAYMSFTGMGNMHMSKKVEGQAKMSGMHKMPDGSMMMNDGSAMNMMDMTMTDMVKMMDGKSGQDLEREFLTGMIPHHQGAVDMAKVLLKDKTISQEIKTFAENIIKAQETEIQMMSKWLKK
jgi:uncharacterized protein (DUF305 family)